MSENKGQLIIYQSEDGSVTLDTKLENDTIWLTQKAMAELFGVKVPAISKHLKNIFNAGELNEEVVISKTETVEEPKAEEKPKAVKVVKNASRGKNK